MQIAFNDMTIKKKAERTYMDIQKRKSSREKGAREALEFGIDNMHRVRKRKYHSSINKTRY